MIEREVAWQKKKLLSLSERKYAIFAAGNYAKTFYTHLKNDLDTDIEFFIDNNPRLSDQIINGKPIMYKPWDKISDFSEKYQVLISTSANNFNQISNELDEIGTPYSSSDAYYVTCHWERIKTNVKNMADDVSKFSYLALIWYWLTYDDSIHYVVDNQYFAIPQFASPFNEVICDVGAYVGDTIEEFISRSIGRCKIYAFEPSDNLRSAIKERIKRLSIEWNLSDDTIQLINACVGRENKTVRFAELGKTSDMVIDSEDAGVEKQLCSIDAFFADKEPPTFIKADIEGFETDLLIGATETIRKTKPKLAICIYHNPYDTVYVPEYVHSIYPEYKIAVRNHIACRLLDTVCYCWT